MDGAKVKLSEAELALAADPQVMLAKIAVTDAVYSLFGRLARLQSERIAAVRHRFGPVFDTPPKISRGERYRDLPYVMLDHPRLFGEYDIFAIRTLFWWGRFFSVTLHLRGAWRERLSDTIGQQREWLGLRGYHLSTGMHEWEHHFGADNYLPVSDMGEDGWRASLSQGDFTKLAVRFPVSRFNDMEELLAGAFDELMGIAERGV